MGYKHGLSSTRIYKIRKYMLKRCNNPHNKQFCNYGGRGISVCAEWADKDNGALNFYNWALSNGYSDDLTIDRIDVNRNYEPENCRWIPMKYQAWNQRHGNNKTGHTGVWSERSGKYYAMISMNKKTVRLGTFDTVEEASAAYQKAKKERDMFVYHPEEALGCDG